jgi:hypothetical protein
MKKKRCTFFSSGDPSLFSKDHFFSFRKKKNEKEKRE